MPLTRRTLTPLEQRDIDRAKGQELGTIGEINPSPFANNPFPGSSPQVTSLPGQLDLNAATTSPVRPEQVSPPTNKGGVQPVQQPVQQPNKGGRPSQNTTKGSQL